MSLIKPFKDYSDHDVINLFRLNSGTLPFTKGNFVKVGSGIQTTDTTQQLGDVGAHFNNIVSQRWGAQPTVVPCTDSGDNTIGLTLYDVREVDENGERLIYNPDKAARMQAVISGQTVPVLNRASILVISGVNGTPTAGAPAYLGFSGDGVMTSAGPVRVGTFLGPKGPDGWTYIKLNIQG